MLVDTLAILFVIIVVLWLVGLSLWTLCGLAAFTLGVTGLWPRRLAGRPVTRYREVPLALRTAVLKRDGWACVYCGSKEELQIDHIIPVSRGGATVLGNLEVLCKPCNQEKGAK